MNTGTWHLVSCASGSAFIPSTATILPEHAESYDGTNVATVTVRACARPGDCPFADAVDVTIYDEYVAYGSPPAISLKIRNVGNKAFMEWTTDQSAVEVRLHPVETDWTSKSGSAGSHTVANLATHGQEVTAQIRLADGAPIGRSETLVVDATGPERGTVSLNLAAGQVTWTPFVDPESGVSPYVDVCLMPVATSADAPVHDTAGTFFGSLVPANVELTSSLGGSFTFDESPFVGTVVRQFAYASTEVLTVTPQLVLADGSVVVTGTSRSAGGTYAFDDSGDVVVPDTGGEAVYARLSWSPGSSSIDALRSSSGLAPLFAIDSGVTSSWASCTLTESSLLDTGSWDLDVSSLSEGTTYVALVRGANLRNVETEGVSRPETFNPTSLFGLGGDPWHRSVDPAADANLDDGVAADAAKLRDVVRSTTELADGAASLSGTSSSEEVASLVEAELVSITLDSTHQVLVTATAPVGHDAQSVQALVWIGTSRFGAQLARPLLDTFTFDMSTLEAAYAAVTASDIPFICASVAYTDVSTGSRISSGSACMCVDGTTTSCDVELTLEQDL